MRLTISSFLITLIIVTIMISIFQLLLTRKKSHALFRVDFLAIMLIAILLRLMFPIELPFTFSIYSSVIMTTIRDFLLYEYQSPFSILHLLLGIWFIGSLFQLIRYVWILKELEHLLTGFQQTARHHTLSEYTKDKKNINIYITNAVSTPIVMGLHPSIYLPAITYTEKELHNILCHELQHIQHKDLLIKHFINGLVILYWWFIPIYIFRKQIDLYLEMRADEAVLKNMNKYEYLEYVQSMLNIQKKQIEKHVLSPKLAICFISDGTKKLSYRIDYLLKGKPDRKTNIIFLLFAFLLPFIGNSIIIEPSYLHTSALIKNTYSEEEVAESYIIQYADGTYEIVINGDKIPLAEPPLATDMPIIKE